MAASTSQVAPLWAGLQAHADTLKGTHLRELMTDTARNDAMFVRHGGIVLDYSRMKIDMAGMDKLVAMADAAKLDECKMMMYSGAKINPTENRSVLHVALRAARETVIESDGANVVPDVWKTLDRIKTFSDKVRSGEWKGHTGKTLTDVIHIGIGGSALGVEFVFEAFKTAPGAYEASTGRRLHFLMNVDPIDVKRALEGFDPETTLVVICSKTFTTAETMMNAMTVRKWLVDKLGEEALSKHLAANSTALDKTKAFGILDDNVFGFWDWVGGRFSCWSAVGALSMSLQYGFDVFEQFLQGGRAMDKHFLEAPIRENLPTLLGLLQVWNASAMGYEATAILPYCQALTRFVAHLQQLDMESNGKRVKLDGSPVDVGTGAIYMGEPGTNGQHSFYQLMHQGRVIPAEFIGFRTSQNPIQLEGAASSNHDELMSNFFAQPDALAMGKTEEEMRAEGVPEELVKHKTFPGDRPSLSMLLPTASPFVLGQLLAMYEHRTAVQGWLWEINSFDQWGVQLGKVLATDVGKFLAKKRKGDGDDASTMHAQTKRLLQSYVDDA